MLNEGVISSLIQKFRQEVCSFDGTRNEIRLVQYNNIMAYYNECTKP